MAEQRDRTPANIALIGMMGSGKSAVGRILAHGLGWDFVDTDARIVERAGKPIAEIFEEEGEAKFRDMESREISDAVTGERRVIATGGGAILRLENRDNLWDRCRVIWLRVSAGEAVRRASLGERRPLLESPNPLTAARKILQRRERLYSLADAVFDTDGMTPEEVARQIQESDLLLAE